MSPSDGSVRYCSRLTTNSSLSADLELLLANCVGAWAWALLSSTCIFSSVTSSTFSALMNACASWNAGRGQRMKKETASGGGRVTVLKPHTQIKNTKRGPCGGFLHRLWSYAKSEPNSCVTAWVIRIVREQRILLGFGVRTARLCFGCLSIAEGKMRGN